MSLSHIIDLGLVILTIILLLSFVYKASTGKFMEEKKIAINTGLLIDTILSSNGNTLLSIDIANNTLSITDVKVEAGEKWNQKFYLLSDQNIDVLSDLIFENTTKISLLKTGNRLYIGKDLLFRPSIPCPFVLMNKPNNLTIITEQESIENNDLFIINLKQVLEFYTPHIEITNNLTKSASLTIKVQSTDEDTIKVEIPTNSIESRRLACVIINKLQIDNPTLDAHIIAIEHQLFNKSQNAIILTINNELKTLETTTSLSNAFKSTFT